MTKKHSKIKKVKKAVKPTKIALAFKKTNSSLKNNIKNKSVPPSTAKAAKQIPIVEKKKIIVKKTAISVKKVIAKKADVLPIKKGATKNKVNKSIPPSGKNMPKLAVKSEKESVKKITSLVKPLISIVPKKPVKVVKEKKAAKKEESLSIKGEFENEFKKPARKSKGGRKPKNKNEDDDEPVIENDLLIQQLINSTKRLKKPSKVPKQLRTFTNPMASLAVAQLLNTNKKGLALPKKEPKGKFELEYVMHTSAGILFEFLTSPSGLAEWFADDVNIHEGVFTFFWEGSEQKARLLGFKDEKFVRLQWLDKPDGTYFEFRIERDELTGDVSLIITDFADEAADLKTSKLLWDSQINKLLHVIGSY